ncbi:outer membrane lipoprotein-sorting protein [Ralstonia solanacearum]|uniref:outer membrane lipoprotein-sorting protein n=1 Tax=Ralstonia solanacearum TaxID=305 RepID=UPI001E58AA6D|nr:outer membrane lipoprotein-sorting protein [Ralstonia solanacearum]
MTRLHFLALGLTCTLAASAAAAADAASAGRLSAAQIAERNVAARGGLQAWRAVNTMVMAGQIEAGGKKNTALPFVMTMKRPHKNRFEIQFQGQTALQVYDGSQGWKVRPFLGRNEVNPYTPDELKSAAASAELDGPLMDYASKGTQIAVQGVETVEGHGAYKLKLTMKDGSTRHLWIDASTFLDIKTDGEPRRLDGKMHDVAVYFRDYRIEHGLKVPHVLETAVQGVKQTHKITIERVTVNAPADDALFAKPQLASAQTARQ